MEEHSSYFEPACREPRLVELSAVFFFTGDAGLGKINA